MFKKFNLILAFLLSLFYYFLLNINTNYNYKYLINIYIIIVGFVTTYIILTALMFVLAYLSSLFLRRRTKRSKIINFIFSHFCKFVMDLAHVKIKVEGLDKVPHNQKYMVIYNHKSNFDPMILAYYLRKDSLLSISKPENFKIPICGNYMLAMNYLSIDRNNPKNALKTINEAIHYIQNNEYSVAISPEGTRNKTNEILLPFHSGTFKLGLKARCPIVITTFKNTETIHKNFPFKRTIVNFKVIKVLNFEDYQDLNTNEISEMCRNLILKEIGEN